MLRAWEVYRSGMLKMAVAACVVSGCSLATVTPVSSSWTPDSGRAPVCDADPRHPVVIDALLAGLAGIAAIGGFASINDAEGDGQLGFVALGIGAATVTVGFVASAIVGRRRGIQCRAALMDFAASR